MGLSKNITLDTGITVNNAYFRIDTISGYKGGIDYGVNCYNSREDFLNGKSYLQPTKYYHFTPDVSDAGKNFIKQGYLNLKQEMDFRGAIDVLEEAQTAS